MADLARALDIYSAATDYMRRAGLQREIEWQRDIDVDELNESYLLAETAWVILCSGFRESVVRRVFGYVSLCFCDWESAEAIVKAQPHCESAAARGFRNERKLKAIGSAARRIHEVGFSKIRSAILEDPIEELQKFEFIGSVTVWHLAKNLGLNVAKPDRHLVRAATSLGFATASALCHAVAAVHREQLKVVDLVLWRYLADASADERRRVLLG